MSNGADIPLGSPLDESVITGLIDAARDAMGNAYCPYSNFPVGAAVLTAEGKVFTGANVENASYGLTICAERSAIFAAVGSGATEIVAVAVVTKTDPPSRPCGACRQVIVEFSLSERQTVIICAGPSGDFVTDTIDILLPQSFSLL